MSGEGTAPAAGAVWGGAALTAPLEGEKGAAPAATLATRGAEEEVAVYEGEEGAA